MMKKLVTVIVIIIIIVAAYFLFTGDSVDEPVVPADTTEEVADVEADEAVVDEVDETEAVEADTEVEL